MIKILHEKKNEIRMEKDKNSIYLKSRNVIQKYSTRNYCLPKTTINCKANQSRNIVVSIEFYVDTNSYSR